MPITEKSLLSNPEYEVICFQSTSTHKRSDETDTSINLHEVMPHMREKREFRTFPSLALHGFLLIHIVPAYIIH